MGTWVRGGHGEVSTQVQAATPGCRSDLARGRRHAPAGPGVEAATGAGNRSGSCAPKGRRAATRQPSHACCFRGQRPCLAGPPPAQAAVDLTCASMASGLPSSPVRIVTRLAIVLASVSRMTLQQVRRGPGRQSTWVCLWSRVRGPSSATRLTDNGADNSPTVALRRPCLQGPRAAWPAPSCAASPLGHSRPQAALPQPRQRHAATAAAPPTASPSLADLVHGQQHQVKVLKHLRRGGHGALQGTHVSSKE